MMRVLLTGGNGQLSHDLRLVFADDADVVALAHAKLDVTNAAQVGARLGVEKPDVVINTAAFTRVDDCEKQVDHAFAVNAFGVLHLARACEAMNATLVQISTDYVFTGPGSMPFTEIDPPRPPNVYGISKLAGEKFARAYCTRHFVVRSAGLYGVAGSSGKGGNFVETMLRLAKSGKPIRVVNDQMLTPTYTADLAVKIRELIMTQRYGLYHLTNGGACTWFEFAKEIFRLTGLDPELTPITSAEYGAAARRPAFSVLDNGKATALGLTPMRPWQEALAAHLRAKGHIA